MNFFNISNAILVGVPGFDCDKVVQPVPEQQEIIESAELEVEVDWSQPSTCFLQTPVHPALSLPPSPGTVEDGEATSSHQKENSPYATNSKCCKIIK